MSTPFRMYRSLNLCTCITEHVNCMWAVYGAAVELRTLIRVKTNSYCSVIALIQRTELNCDTCAFDRQTPSTAEPTDRPFIPKAFKVNGYCHWIRWLVSFNTCKVKGKVVVCIIQFFNSFDNILHDPNLTPHITTIVLEQDVSGKCICFSSIQKHSHLFSRNMSSSSLVSVPIEWNVHKHGRNIELLACCESVAETARASACVRANHFLKTTARKRLVVRRCNSRWLQVKHML